MVPNDNQVQHWEDVLHGEHVLACGYVGPAVVKLQHKLTRAGYDLDITGILGPTTEKALRDFQERRAIPVTGRLGARTAQALDNYDDTHWEAVMNGQIILRLGDDNPAVEVLQTLLSQARFTVEKTGVFGPTTRNRVLELQKSSRIPASGEVNEKTAHALVGRQENEEEFVSPMGDAIGLVRRGDFLMAPAVAKAFDRMERAARGDGVELTLLDAYRDPRRQHEVAAQRDPAKQGSCTLNPGQNVHGTGTALDLNDGLVSVSSEELWEEIKSKIHAKNPLSFFRKS